MKKTQRGITMIEILVALLVMAVGLLGVAGMQTVSMQQTQGADRRSVATLLAQTMADEIRANRGIPSDAVKEQWLQAVKEDLGADASAKVTESVSGQQALVSLEWTARKTQWDAVAEGEGDTEETPMNKNKFEVTVRYAR